MSHGGRRAGWTRPVLRFGLASAFAVPLAVLLSACYPNPNDLRGTPGGSGGSGGPGSGGATGSGGQASGTGGQLIGSGGAIGSGGRVGTGGAPAGTGGYVGAGTALTPDANGWVAGWTNKYGIQGAWYAFADGTGPDGTAATSPCILAGHPAAACTMFTSGCAPGVRRPLTRFRGGAQSGGNRWRTRIARMCPSPRSTTRGRDEIENVDRNVMGMMGMMIHRDGSWCTVGGDMQALARRRQYGEPVRRLSLRIRFGPRHTRGLETELENIECSALQIRGPLVHVPFHLPVNRPGFKSEDCHP